MSDLFPFFLVALFIVLSVLIVNFAYWLFWILYRCIIEVFKFNKVVLFKTINSLEFNFQYSFLFDKIPPFMKGIVGWRRLIILFCLVLFYGLFFGFLINFMVVLLPLLSLATLDNMELLLCYLRDAANNMVQ